jgi:hypothetical protein
MVYDNPKEIEEEELRRFKTWSVGKETYDTNIIRGQTKGNGYVRQGIWRKRINSAYIICTWDSHTNTFKAVKHTNIIKEGSRNLYATSIVRRNITSEEFDAPFDDETLEAFRKIACMDWKDRDNGKAVKWYEYEEIRPNTKNGLKEVTHIIKSPNSKTIATCTTKSAAKDIVEGLNMLKKSRMGN